MPPKDKKQLEGTEREELLAWIDSYLEAEALAGAGDPGPVMLRRLSNAEYAYTIADLTGIEGLDPTREFPVDSAAGEGFTNTGNSLVMSPALLEKFLEAGKEIASHAVLLPDGFRFSRSKTRRDWSNEIMEELRQRYRETLGVGEIDFSYRGRQVGSERPIDLSEGRLNYEVYFAALLKHRDRLRENLANAASIALLEGVNEKYLTILARELILDPSGEGSLLLRELRSRLKRAGVEEAAAITGEVRAWQDRLWRFNKVGHLAAVQAWQVPTSPKGTRRDFMIKAPAGPSGDFEISLFAGTAGDGREHDHVVWERPRFTRRPGVAPLLLRDLRGAAVVFPRYRDQVIGNIAVYLKIARQARDVGKGIDVGQLASKNGVSPEQLGPFLNYLGIVDTGDGGITGHLTLQKRNVGNEAISGWGMQGQRDLSLLGNSSDATWRIPGEVPPHRIVVHPMPDRWVGTAWKSPMNGRAKVTVFVHDRHGCGNGVRWSAEHRRGSQRRVLESGHADPNRLAETDPAECDLEEGDIISLTIGSRGGNHACDLTEIDLVIDESGGDRRRWSLAADCADNILQGNPHTDGYGNVETWHFVSGTERPGDDAAVIPLGSVLSRWLDSEDAAEADGLARELQEMLASPAGEGLSEADRRLYGQLRDADGPLFAGLDLSELARTATEAELELGEYGIHPGVFEENGDLRVTAPRSLRFDVPLELLGESDFLASGRLDPESGNEGTVQLFATSGEAPATERLRPGVEITVAAESESERRIEKAFEDFRDLFPVAMCYARVVPIDEVVTLVLYHREDEHLNRLMVDESGKAVFDRLWSELHFVSQDAFEIVAALEQILEYATQDADPTKFDPVREPIAREARALESWLEASAPAQLTALVRFAEQAYRRPLSQREEDAFRGLYANLRGSDLSHDAAFRLVLARVFASPAFLYKLESVPAGEQGPVNDWELATRLSYFLWSTAPDQSLRETAAKGSLSSVDTLVAQTDRMLDDPRIRRLAVEFACQWLHIRGFDGFDEKNERQFPEFRQLRGAMYEEAVRFFTDLFRNNGSILSILDGDHTFVNSELAAFYGVEVGESDEDRGWWKLGSHRARGRGGILGMASTLARQSGASRTSPILRGTWISETLLGEKLPRPPKDVPQLPDAAPVGQTERQLIERHSSDPACAKCHARIDPYGFALEHFDAIGRRRVVSANGDAIDSSARLEDGTEFAGLDGLREYLAETRTDDFLRQFCRKLLGYSLGREVILSDKPLIDEMMRHLSENGYRFHDAVHFIVKSRQFREIRGAGRPEASIR